MLEAGVQSGAARGSQGGTSQGLGRTQSFLAVITLGQSAVPGLTSHICILQDCRTAGLQDYLFLSGTDWVVTPPSPVRSAGNQRRKKLKTEYFTRQERSGEIRCWTLQDKINQKIIFIKGQDWLARPGTQLHLNRKEWKYSSSSEERTEEGVY